MSATSDLDDDDRGFGGWVLRAVAADDVRAAIKDFGQVWRFPVEPGPAADRLEAGAPCFLFVDDPALKPTQAGIWAVGEVVGPTYAVVDNHRLAPDDGPATEAGPGARVECLYAEVELLPLKVRITRPELQAHRVLRRAAFLADAGRAGPVPLRRADVRALEEWDFDLVEPTGDQVARLDAALAALEATGDGWTDPADPDLSEPEAETPETPATDSA